MDQIKHAISLDCERLIDIFVRNERKDFPSFCREWKIMCFQHMYSGLLRDIEIIQMTENIFHVSGRMFFEENAGPMHEERKIGILYLIYAIYFKQPTYKYVKFKLTLERWRSLKIFIESIRADPKNVQAIYIFYQLIAANAFRFVLTEQYCGLEEVLNANFIKQNRKRHQIWDTVRVDVGEINHPKIGLITSLAVLEGGYNEMKKIINNQDAEYYGLHQKLEITNISNEIKNLFQNVSFALKPRFEEQKDKNCASQESYKTAKRLPINERRQKIRRKAIKNAGNSEDFRYNVFMAGDIIHISKEDVRPRVRVQTAGSIFDQALFPDVINELSSKDDHVYLDDN